MVRRPVVAVLLHHLPVVDRAHERRPHGRPVGGKAVRGHLGDHEQTTAQVHHERVGRGLVTLADEVRDHELRAAAEAHEGPRVAMLRGIFFGHPRGFFLNEGPLLVRFDLRGNHAANELVVKPGAALSDGDRKAEDRRLRDPGHALGGPDAVALAERGDDGRARLAR